MRAWACEGKDQGLELGAGSDFPPELLRAVRSPQAWSRRVGEGFPMWPALGLGLPDLESPS